MQSSFVVEESERRYRRACRSLATGVSSGLRLQCKPVPLFFERADGPYYYDVDGHELIDYTLAWGPLIVGSNHAGINAAVTRQLGRCYTIGAQHDGEAELAELMASSAPGVEQVVFCNTGSEAVQAAIRLARAATGRDKVIKFEGHYHGWINNMLVSYKPKGGTPFETQPGCGGQAAHEYADTIVLPWNDAGALKDLLSKRGGEVACVITEPILTNNGSCMPEDGYLREVVRLCAANGAVSIFDEVITGFRLAPGGARAFFDVQPDLSVYAKAMGGGFTIAAVGGRKEMFDVLRDGRTVHPGTYNGSPINIAASIATINALREPGVYERMHRHGRALREAIERSGAAHGQTLATSGVGTAFHVLFGRTSPPRDYRDSLSADMETYARFRLALLARGVHLMPDGRWYVGASHTDRELAKAAGAIESAMEEIACRR